MLLGIIILIVKCMVVAVAMVSTVPMSLLAERRLSAFIQDRLGPNRVGPFGLLQPVADVIKFFFKEEFVPDKANKIIYIIAPLIAFVPGVITFAVIPWGNVSWGNSFATGETTGFLIGSTGSLAVADVGIGILFVIAISSLNAYGLAYGGWSSNNKYSLLGGLRSSAQIISFEIAMGLVLISILMSTGSVDLNKIVIDQKDVFWGFIPNWLCFRQPLAFLLFIITAFAETNRLPFDMPEAEPELVGGYHTEYSSMKFAMFFMGEYIAMATMSAVITTLFLGGWYFPGMEALFPAETTSPIVIGIISSFIFSAKTAFILFFFIWVRWTLPRVRWDQLMKTGWSILIPLALLNIVLTAIIKSI
ncbi:MAG: NADH-quinone oxidoreductase subunit NuoH [Spirochaetota bacterium]|nr:NADH-quinone oxidoreductase subunit NuoH [Spirochaetota bacterium]